MSQSLLGEFADNLIDALFLGLRDHTVLLGITPEANHDATHGTIHSANPGGAVVQLGFVADRPEKLRRPHRQSIMSLFQQARALGYNPQQIELRVGKYRRVYVEDKLEPVYQQRLS
jgi:hypothetical protein